jgi:phage terminase large subunit-like protein
MKINDIIANKDYRRTLGVKNHQAFFAIYFPEYLQYRSAKLHKDLFRVTEHDELKMTVIVAFRGSGKSTIVTTSYPIWAILARGVKFIMILTQNQSQAKFVLGNIKSQLENNLLLKSDFGPFQDVNAEWTSNSIYIKKYNAKITVASVGESIRGIRHNESRPQIVICDDVEDTLSTKSRDNRQKTYKWFKSEVLPLGDLKTKHLIIGNLLHRDCLVMKLKRQIEKQEFKAKYLEYPLIVNGRIMWPGKYSSRKIFEEERAKIDDPIIWKREYLLEIVADEDQIVQPEWIKYYSDIPIGTCPFDVMAVDMAFTENAKSDRTAIVTATVTSLNDKPYVYIHYEYVNSKMLPTETVDVIKSVYKTLNGGSSRKIYVETNGVQKGYKSFFEQEGLYITEVSPGNMSKREKLAMASRFIRNGHVLFPQREGSELVEQILNFGIENNDDLLDAFCYLVNESILNYRVPFNVVTDLAFV